MVVLRHWPLYQLDIKNVFLHSDCKDEVYKEQPPHLVARGGGGDLIALYVDCIGHSMG